VAGELKKGRGISLRLRVTTVAKVPFRKAYHSYQSELLEQDQSSSVSKTSKRLGKIISVGFLLAIVIGGVYAGYVAMQTFNFTSASSPIANKAYTISFLANVGTPTLIGCGVPPATPCFTVTSATGVNVNVTASSSVPSGSGVTLNLIQILPLTQTCSSTMPVVLTGLIIVPLPGNGTAKITLVGGTDYQYCIYYTSSATVSSGAFSVTFQG
jgi:hypothetical protein